MMDGYCLSTMSRPQLHQRNKVIGEWEMMKDLIVLFCFAPTQLPFSPLKPRSGDLTKIGRFSSQTNRLVFWVTWVE